jgi:hypothetical protein
MSSSYTSRGMVLCMAQSDKNTVGDGMSFFRNPEETRTRPQDIQRPTSKGKSTVGRFFGFKPHIINDRGEILDS